MANKIDNLVYRGQGGTLSKLPYHGTTETKITPLKQEAKRKAVSPTKKRVAVTQGVSKTKNKIYK